MSGIIELVVLIGKTGKEISDIWEKETSKKKRIFIGSTKRINGFRLLEAQVHAMQGEETRFKFPEFNFAFLGEGENLLELIKKMNISPNKIAVIISKQDSFIEEIFKDKKPKGRYHYSEDYGWIVVYKGKVKSQELNEFVGKFFNEKMINPNANYYDEEIDEALRYARKKNEINRIISENSKKK